MFVFDGGTLDEEAIQDLRLTDDELRQFQLVTVDGARKLLRPYVWARLEKAVQAKADSKTAYVEPSISPIDKV